MLCIPPSTHGLLIGLLVGIVSIALLQARGARSKGKRTIVLSSAYICGILAWPYVWNAVAHELNSGSALTQGAFLWPMAYLAFETYLLEKYQSGVDSKRGTLQMDANGVCSMTFALFGIMGARHDRFEARIFNTAILCCLAFILPSFDAPADSLENILLEAVQRVLLVYSTGLMLAGSTHLAVQQSQSCAT